MADQVEREQRNFPTDFHLTAARQESRAGSTGRNVSGYAAVFNSLSESLAGFVEICAAGCFTEVLKSPSLDVACLFNHDPSRVLSRTKSGSLKLAQDAHGLAYSFALSDASYARDLALALSRGDVYQSSFSFTVGRDSWKKVGGLTVRTLEVISDLFDVSPVTFPAYRATSVQLRDVLDGRTLADFRAELDAAPTIPEPTGWRVALAKRRLQLAEAGAH